MRTVWPRSVTSTPGATAWQSATVPTAVITPVAESKAIACARGFAGSIVMMEAALRITAVIIVSLGGRGRSG